MEIQRVGCQHDDQKRGRDERRRTPSPNPQRQPTLKPEIGNRTGTSHSGREDRPPCFNHNTGQCPNDRTCDDWHPSTLRVSQDALDAEQVPYVVSSIKKIQSRKNIKRTRSDTQTRSPKHTKAGAHLLHESKVHAEEKESMAVRIFEKGSFKRSTKESSVKKAVRFSEDDIQFADFQEARPTRWRNDLFPNSLEVQDLSADWTEPRGRFTTHRVQTSQGERQEKRSLQRHEQQVLQRLLSSQGRSKCICVNTDHSVAGQDVHCRQWCFLTDDGVTSISPKENDIIGKTKRTSGAVLSTTEAKVHIQVFGASVL